MPIDAESPPNAESTLAVPGTLCVTPFPGGNLVHVGAAAGWMVPRGLLRWEREISFLARADMTADLGRSLRATLPHEQIAPKKFPLAYRALETAPFLALTRKLAAEARQQGLRVHTVGVDRVSAGFFYFAEGGEGAPVRAQGNLVEMLAVSLKPSATNAEIAALQDGLVDRLLAFFSNGLVSELAVELADALPRMANDGTGLAGTQLEVFELQARALSSRSARWESSARDIADALQAAAGKSERTVRVPLYGEARQQMLRPLKILLGGETITLPARYRWTVMGQPREELKSPDRPQAAQSIAQPTPSPPRTGPAVPRPELGSGMKRLPKQPGGPVEDVMPTRANAANASGASSAVSAASAAATLADSKDAGPKAESKPAITEAAPAAREEAKSQEPARKEPAEEAPREAEKAKPSPDGAPARDGAKGEEAPPKKREKPAAAAESKPAAPSRSPAKETRRSGPRAIVVLLVLATAAAVYVRWHEDIVRFVSQYIHPG
jgi:hypothetical protein